MACKSAALGDAAAHSADDKVRSAAFTRAGKMQRMAAVKRIIFADDAADPHNFLLKIAG